MDEFGIEKIDADYVRVGHDPARSGILRTIKNLLGVLRHPLETYAIWRQERVYRNMDSFERRDHQIQQERNSYELL